MKFNTYSFKELLSNIVDNRGKTCPVSNTGLPLIATNCIKADTLYPVFEKVRHVSNETYKNWFRGHPEPGDIIFVCKGSPGRVAWTPNPVNFCIAQDMLAIRANERIVDSKFLFALLRQNRTLTMIENMHVGTMIPHFKKGDFDSLFLKVPEDRGIQKYIGETYFELSEKIELNRQMNQTLEAMAQALFKSWFVDFDPVLDNALAAGHEIPEALQFKAEKRKKLSSLEGGVPTGRGGRLLDTNQALSALFPSSFVFNETLNKWIPEEWEVMKLIELVSVKYGKDHKKLEEGEIPCYGSGGIMRHVEQALYDHESVLIPRKGTLNNIIYVNHPFWSVDTMFYTIMEKEDFAKYFFYTMNRLNFDEMNEGSAVPSMTTAQLNSMDILLPSQAILESFDSLVTKYFNKQEANESETETLTQLRDTLLPQLISGKVRVPESVIERMN
ncbi:restriction endonuclease subunit S [Algoriphagus sediminis]|uniref:Restriction endonuclease subunit S n=1 Tax=Algoriphagus sediminis TaxID=3057113 RepID=A0ABT7YB75_9BACT|nr:restriction endonuclease subunit S [Algoriphagus sediminis]MDN3203772.1 restriction endonuclease subunit S [Algoriphagus sediminis]